MSATCTDAGSYRRRDELRAALPAADRGGWCDTRTGAEVSREWLANGGVSNATPVEVAELADYCWHSLPPRTSGAERQQETK